MHAHVVTIEKTQYKQRPGKRQELLLDTDKPYVTLHVDLGCVDGKCTY